MNQHQLDVCFGQRTDNCRSVCKRAGRTAPQLVPFKLVHQGRHLRGGGERESVFADIHTPIVTGPFIDVAKPGAVTIAEICGRKPMRLTVGSDQYIRCLFKGSRLCLIHDFLRRNP
jgi:hypothetical protein